MLKVLNLEERTGMGTKELSLVLSDDSPNGDYVFYGDYISFGTWDEIEPTIMESNNFKILENTLKMYSVSNNLIQKVLDEKNWKNITEK